MNKVAITRQGRIMIITLARIEVRNAVDGEAAAELADAFRQFEAAIDVDVAVLQGEGGHFCAGADLKALAAGDGSNRLSPDGDAPMGPSRMHLSKPVIAAVAGHAVAGGLELACWCDLRVAERDAVFGVYCRRWGVPLIDGGTLRLPRLIGHSRAMDMILTGRAVGAQEALAMGLVNRLAEPGQALRDALTLAEELCQFPQNCLRSDRASVYEQWGMSEKEALRNEYWHGLEVIGSKETANGAARFASGKGRHGDFDDI